jgi:hypothetical protein
VLPAQNTNPNACDELWVRSVKEECVSRVILFSERSLRRVDEHRADDGYVQIADVSAATFYEAGEPAVRAAVDLGGARTTLTVPLAKDEELLGLLIFQPTSIDGIEPTA